MPVMKEGILYLLRNRKTYLLHQFIQHQTLPSPADSGRSSIETTFQCPTDLEELLKTNQTTVRVCNRFLVFINAAHK
jgi:hypothetical protein